jgi:hypothetical protein
MRTLRELKTDLKKENIDYRKAVRAKCLDCMCDQHTDCEIPGCSLYRFQPFRKSKSLKRAQVER